MCQENTCNSKVHCYKEKEQVQGETWCSLVSGDGKVQGPARGKRRTSLRGRSAASPKNSQNARRTLPDSKEIDAMRCWTRLLKGHQSTLLMKSLEMLKDRVANQSGAERLQLSEE